MGERVSTPLRDERETAAIRPEELEAMVERTMKEGEPPATRLLARSSSRGRLRIDIATLLREVTGELARIRPGSRWRLDVEPALEIDADRESLRAALVSIGDHFAGSQRGVNAYDVSVHPAPAWVAEVPSAAILVRAADRRGLVSSMVPAFQENRAASLLAVARSVGVLHEHGATARALPREGLLVAVLPLGA